MKKNSVLLLLLVYFTTIFLVGCEDDWVRHTINSSIEETKKETGLEYDEITEIVCDPGQDTAFWAEDYDLLGKLTNLESITIIGIAKEAAQLFFGELANLEKLKSVEIIDSHIDSISKLAEIKNLSSLSLKSVSYSKIYDIDLLGEKGSFLNLKTLKLESGNFERLPDLSKLNVLESLTVSHSNISTLDYEHVNWDKLVHLDINFNSIKEIDDRIVDDLYNLESLNISYTDIDDIQFVLRLPKLIKFSYRHHEDNSVDMEPLREHPNFNESWLNNGY